MPCARALALRQKQKAPQRNWPRNRPRAKASALLKARREKPPDLSRRDRRPGIRTLNGWLLILRFEVVPRARVRCLEKWRLAFPDGQLLRPGKFRSGSLRSLPATWPALRVRLRHPLPLGDRRHGQIPAFPMRLKADYAHFHVAAFVRSSFANRANELQRGVAWCHGGPHVHVYIISRIQPAPIPLSFKE